MNKTPGLLMAVFAAIFSSSVLAGDISGFWQHEDEPGWIEIRFEDGIGTGTVVRNDKYPEREGRVLLKDISVQDDGWRGQVFAERLQEYKDAALTLPTPDQLQIKVKVGFMSRTLNWNRVSVLPES